MTSWSPDGERRPVALQQGLENGARSRLCCMLSGWQWWWEVGARLQAADVEPSHLSPLYPPQGFLCSSLARGWVASWPSRMLRESG